MSLVITDIVTDFGAYYKPGSDNQKNLRKMLYKPSETAAFFQPRPTEDTIWRGTFASLTRVLQPFQKAFTPISSLTFQPNSFDLYKLKIDAKEYPDELEPSFVGFLANMEELDRTKWPFGRYWVEEHLLPKSVEDFETLECFAGVYAAPAPGVAGAAGTSMNGLRKVIRTYNTAGRTNLGDGAIVTGAAAGDDADFCTQVEEFVADIPSLFRSKIDHVFMSKALELKYKRGKRKKYAAYVNFIESPGLYTIEDFPNVSVKGLESHEGSGLYWASPSINRINPKKKAALKNTMVLKEFSAREVSAYTDWWECLNYEVPEFIFHNDQDLA